MLGRLALDVGNLKVAGDRRCRLTTGNALENLDIPKVNLLFHHEDLGGY